MEEEVLNMPSELLPVPFFDDDSFVSEELDGDDALVTIENINSPLIEAFEIQEIIRPDINIAKWAGVLFASPWSKNLTNSKKFTWKTIVDGNPVEAFLLIRPVNGQKRPTTTTYKHLLGMFQLWEKRGRPEDGVIDFSAREYCEVMEKKWQGSGTAKTIKEQLDIMRYSAITWAYSYSSEKGKVDSYHSGMTLLSDHTYLERKYAKKANRFDSLHRAKIDLRMINNVLTGNTKPVNYKTLISIKNGTAEAIYTMADTILSSGKKKWERKLKNLFIDDLSLGERYERLGNRVAKAKEVSPYLNNKTLSNNNILKLVVEETVDGTDYKIVCTQKEVIKNKNKKKKINMTVEEIESISDEIIVNLSSVGLLKEEAARKTIKNLLYYYDKNMLLLCASRVRVEYKGIIKKSPIRTFMYVVHLEAHERGMEWIKDCGKDCKYRPENNKQLDIKIGSHIEEPKNKIEKIKEKPKNNYTQESTVSLHELVKQKKEEVSALGQKLTPIEADKKVKNDYLMELSEEQKKEKLLEAKAVNPELADMITDFNEGGTGYAALRKIIPDFESKVKALTE